jgi:hypothetical protein
LASVNSLANATSHTADVSASAPAIHRADAACTRESDPRREMERPHIMPPFKHEPPRQTTSAVPKRFRAKWIPVRVKKTRQNKDY